MTLESIVQWLGGAAAFSALGIVLYGVWRGTKRVAGRATGFNAGWLRSWGFYFASSLFFFWISWIGWIAIPISVAPTIRSGMLIIGAVIYFPAIALIVWGRLILGKNYFVSTGFGAQLFADHQLITSGPYAIIRHPMYAGLILASIGGLLIYMTWTMVYFVCFAPLTVLRARREEKVLAEEFGEKWIAYCKRVPAFLPKLKRS